MYKIIINLLLILSMSVLAKGFPANSVAKNGDDILAQEEKAQYSSLFLNQIEQMIEQEKIVAEQNYNPYVADGGKIIGNGGKGFVCPEESGQRVYLLDYIKATHDWNLYIIPATGNDEYEKAKELAKRISVFDPIRSKYYVAAINDFKSNHQLINYHDFTYISDYEEYTLPKGCTVEIIINQKMPRFAEDKRYRINNDLWRELSLDDRAGLILHEIIYREAMLLGQKTANNVVYFNAIIAGKIIHINKESYDAILSSINFPHYE